MELITDLWPILALVPAIIIKLTNDLKPFVHKTIIFLVPYLIGISITFFLYLIFNGESLGVYLLNGFIIAFSAVSWYEFSKPKDIKETIKEQNNIHDFTSLSEGW